MNSPRTAVIRALLVDDDEDEYVLLRDVFDRIPAEGGLLLSWVGSFEEGLAAAKAGTHDVFLVDYQLGARSGVELIREAVAAGCRRPLILLTGHGRASVDVTALRAGAADYVEKSAMTPSLIERVIRYALERAKSAEVRTQLEVARGAEEFHKRLLAIVGHDLRTPLTAVIATLGLLERSKEFPESLMPALRRARGGCARMEVMIRDLTDFTRVHIGQRLPIVPERVDFDRVCDQVIAELATSNPTRTITYRHEGQGGGVWDGPRLAQVLTNLLGNALKYGAPGTPVTLTWWREGPVGAQDLVVSVHNEGPHIPEELLPHVFEPFRRGEQTTATTKQSLGLGLFIAKQIVEAHGGVVEVSSSEAKGTTFRVRLPATSSDVEHEHVG